MQFYRPIRRSVCCAHNAYNVKLALRAAFGTTTKRSNANANANANDEKDAPDEDIPSPWESSHWKSLEANPEPEDIKGPEGELDHSPREGDPPVTKQIPSHRVRFIKGNHVLDILTKEAQRSEVVPQKKSEENDKIYDRRMNVIELQDIQPIAWQRAMRAMSDHLHQISNPRAKWINKMSLVMRDRLKERVFDYKPCNVLPMTNSSAEKPPPWERQLRQPRVDGLTHLDEELKAFATWIQPTAKERMARNAVMEETMNLVKASLKDDVSITTKMELHGSEKTGLALPWSDIDIRIWDDREAPAKAGPAAARLFHRLGLVADTMRSSDEWTLVVVRDTAYPILNAQHMKSGLDVQIVAAPNSHGQEAVVKQCLEDMPYLRTVFYAVRTFFAMRRLDEVYTGGLGSYGIFVLLVATILRNPIKNNRGECPHAAAFTTFFETLSPIDARKAQDSNSIARDSKSINLKKFAISCFPRTKFLKHAPSPDLLKYMALAEKRGDKIRAGQWRMSQRNEWMPYLLTLQDPANPHNDLGRKTYAIKHILASITTCDKSLRRRIVAMDARYVQGRPWVGPPMLATVLGRPDAEYKERRKKLEAFGMEIAWETGQVWRKHLSHGVRGQEMEEKKGNDEGTANARMRFHRVSS
ncbi:hypothetical protein AC578_4921 [Pseudocercospora eumusae]|uniref:Polynucleotide adenylyltransferase n=1 Tax=Pseudocercospora eumusae TaxID=321146 RepID=A0A139HNT7_9PEZI|nr:hypothetical protein AC578_4921 [Pseudocercospora eumusae]